MSTIYKKYRREWSTLVALLITFVLFSALEPSYLSATNVATIITQAVTYGLMGIGMTCVIISGGIDLSVGSSLALLACIGALGLVGSEMCIRDRLLSALYWDF